MSSIFGTISLPDLIVRVGAPILAAVILAILRKYWTPIVVKRARQAVVRLPVPMRNVIRRSADQIYPTWRQTGGQSRRNLTLEWRLEHVRTLRKNRFFIFGPAYLDIFLSPISISILTPTEISNLEPVRLDCGGSAAYFGRYLFRTYKEQSQLFTRISIKDDVGRDLEGILRSEEWISNPEFIRLNDVQGAISVHLVQQTEGFHTTFTHRGAASGLCWNPELKTIRKRAKRGGLLYISGYFRTNLSQGLCDALTNLPPTLITMLDHGRFRASEHANAVPELLEAFTGALIDVYICTFEELMLIAKSAGGKFDDIDTFNIRSSLQALIDHGLLPRLTIVRGQIDSSAASAYVVLDGSIEEVSVPAAPSTSAPRRARPVRSRKLPGSRSAFTAGFAHELLSDDSGENLGKTVVDAVRVGLRVWIDDAS